MKRLVYGIVLSVTAFIFFMIGPMSVIAPTMVANADSSGGGRH